MSRIAVFTAKDSTEVRDFFDAEQFSIFEKGEDGWKFVGQKTFEKVMPVAPDVTREKTMKILPLIDGCDALAGGTLVGIPYYVFDRAGLHIFEIGRIGDDILDGIMEDLLNADAAAAARAAIIRDAKPAETSVPGVFFLDLIALQKENPEITSKMALEDFLKYEPFMELRLVCKHVPPWIENCGEYNVLILKYDGGVAEAAITRIYEVNPPSPQCA
jgi:hypothetical protein